MRRDPIVEEVRASRDAIAREHGNDLDAIVSAFRQQDAASGVKVVSLPAKRLPKRPSKHRRVTRRRPKALQPTSRAQAGTTKSKRRARAARG